MLEKIINILAKGIEKTLPSIDKTAPRLILEIISPKIETPWIPGPIVEKLAFYHYFHRIKDYFRGVSLQFLSDWDIEEVLNKRFFSNSGPGGKNIEYIMHAIYSPRGRQEFSISKVKKQKHLNYIEYVKSLPEPLLNQIKDVLEGKNIYIGYYSAPSEHQKTALGLLVRQPAEPFPFSMGYGTDNLESISELYNKANIIIDKDILNKGKIPNHPFDYKESDFYTLLNNPKISRKIDTLIISWPNFEIAQHILDSLLKTGGKLYITPKQLYPILNGYHFVDKGDWLECTRLA